MDVRYRLVMLPVCAALLWLAGCATGSLDEIRSRLPMIASQRRPPVDRAARSGTPLTYELAADVPLRGTSRMPLPGFWETVDRDFRDWPSVFWQDTKDVFTNRQNLVVLGLTYGASLSLQKTGPDDTTEDSLRSHSGFSHEFRDVLAAAGNPGTHFGLAGLWYLVGQQRQDEKTYTVGTKLFRALAVTGTATLLGQAASWDEGPNGESGTFPSGHTASSFAFASVMHHEYGPVAGVPLYVLSGLVGYSRLEDHEHYLSDVVMGGVLGLVVGHTIANDGEPPKLFGGEIMPYADPYSGSTGIAWVKRFK